MPGSRTADRRSGSLLVFGGLTAAVLVGSGYPDAGSGRKPPMPNGWGLLLRGCRIPQLHLGKRATTALGLGWGLVHRSGYGQRHLGLACTRHHGVGLRPWEAD